MQRENCRGQEQKDLQEIFNLVYPPDFPENIKGPAYLQKDLNEYVEQLQPVEVTLTAIFALSLARGLDLPLLYLYDADGESSASGWLRARHYPEMPRKYDGEQWLWTHSDFSMLNILYSSEDGLEEIRDGQWVQVPINKENVKLHIRVGEVYHIWTNALFTNNIHRVSSKAAKDCVSFDYFFSQAQTCGVVSNLFVARMRNPSLLVLQQLCIFCQHIFHR